jgi:hypothetical protein
MKVAITIAALCVASASAAYQGLYTQANTPAYASNPSFWTQDTDLSFDFQTANGDFSALFMDQYYNDGCTKFQQNQGKCTIDWQGMQPAVYNPGNVDNSASNQVRLSVQSSTDQSLFDAANADDTTDCSCEYHDYTAAVIRSRNSYRSGIQCINVRMGDNDKTVVSLWKQSKSEEINGVYLYTNDQGNVMLKTEAFHFEDGNTLSSASTESQVLSNIKSSYAEICEEWLNNDDIRIYYNGDFLHQINGADWRPNAPPIWDREEHYVNLDITLNEDADVSDITATTLNAFVDVRFIHTFEPECVGLNTQLNIQYSPIGSKPFGGPIGTGSACTDAKDWCESYEPRNLCDNPYPGSVAETWWDLANRATDPIDICGFINHDKVCADPDISTRPEGEFNGGRGGLNKCWWDQTDHSASETVKYRLGKCKPWAPARWKIQTLNKKKCTEQASTKRYTQWCFNTCGMQTAVNYEGLTNQNVGSIWKTVCAGHNMGHDWKSSMDSCESFTHAGKNVTTSNGAPFLQVEFATCNGGKKSVYYESESPSLRRSTCYRKWYAAGKAPYDIEMPDGTMDKPVGYYCVPLTSEYLASSRTAILNPGRQKACDWIGGQYTCTENKGKISERCVSPVKTKLTVVDSSLCN